MSMSGIASLALDTATPSRIRFGPIADDAGTSPAAAAPDVRHLTEERLLAEALNGRGGAESARAAEAWKELVARNLDRVKTWVKAFRFPGHADVRIPPDDIGDVTNEAWIRATRMLDGFKGADLEVFRRALRKCTGYTCMDYCRKELGYERGLAGSVDEPMPGSDETGSEAGRFDDALARRATDIAARAERSQEEFGRMAEAIEGLPSEDMKAVLRDTAAGFSSKESAAKHGLSTDNVDQLRFRGLEKLKKRMGDD